MRGVTVSGTNYIYQQNEQLKNILIQSELLHYKMENDLSNNINVYDGVDLSGSIPKFYHIVSNAPAGRFYLGSSLPEFH